MRESLDRKLVVRITEDQYRRLKLNIVEDKVTMSQVIREALRNKLNRKLVVRITEDQYCRLQKNILEDKVSMSQVIREALQNKLNKIVIDDTWKRKFRV